MSPRSFLVLVSLVMVSLVGGVASRAEAPVGVKRTILRKQDLSAAGREGVMAQVEIAPGGREGKHTHAAEVFAYVLEGNPTLEVEGQPTETLAPGATFFIPAGKVHEGINSTDKPVKLVVVFVAEKGKPMTTPVK